MTIDKDIFEKALSPVGVRLPDGAFERFDLYAGLLIAYNEKVNLTAITDPADIVYKHFADSLYLLKYARLPAGAKLCDVGSGAGFPGVCLKLARPDISLTLFESVGKKAAFLTYLCRELGIEAEVVNMRAETAGASPAYRERFDVATARAVAALNKLCEYCLPLVKTGGTFVPLKAPLGEEERQRGYGAARLLGAKPQKTIPYALPGGDAREILIFEKNSPTPPRYPRNSGTIMKKPL
ncbi:MAG: 16S rRNA (guanine(527)-N(7))-methyltransferase RsmG [Clostridia bacterium]|nr:16S rRNA (guanine(527)-N(7))-methyltransferase RsmG [Clostridia bacterium]